MLLRGPSLRTCSLVFPGTEVKAIVCSFSDLYFFPISSWVKIISFFWLLVLSWCHGFSKMIGRSYFVVMWASILSILGYILPGLMNLSLSTLYEWSLSQLFSIISSLPFLYCCSLVLETWNWGEWGNYLGPCCNSCDWLASSNCH